MDIETRRPQIKLNKLIAWRITDMISVLFASFENSAAMSCLTSSRLSHISMHPGLRVVIAVSVVRAIG